MSDKKFEQELIRRKLEEQKLLEKKIEMQRCLPHLYGWKWYPWARKFFESTNKYNFLVAANQISKALDAETLIPGPRGLIPLKELKIGDRVFGQDGRLTRILAIPFNGITHCYKVTFGDGASVIASGDHVWFAKGNKQRFHKRDRPKSSCLGKWQLVTTGDMMREGKYQPKPRSSVHAFVIPYTKPVRFRKKKLPVEPYLLGLLLGDGGFSHSDVVLTTADQEISDHVVSTYGAKKSGRLGYRLNGFQKHMKRLNLMGSRSNTKFIPKRYLRASIKQRMELLKGLMDSDGCADKGGICSYTTVSPRLRDDVVSLVTSLGGRVSWKGRDAFYYRNGEKVKCQHAYRLFIRMPENPFKLLRKAQKYRQFVRKHERVVKSIEYVGERHAICLTVDNSDGSFLCTDRYIVTHNSSTQIRKAIHWATATELWPKLWRTPPMQFWYLYPNKSTSTVEVEKKWVTQFLPRGPYQNHPKYGWRIEKKNKEVHAIHFNTGVSIYMKTYAQDSQDLQTGSCDSIFSDEELPEELLSELQFRIAATNGYFHLVFTATLGQELWRCTMEEKGKYEKFKDAFKQQVSMYDCLFYEDGTPSHWTVERIEELKRQCKSEAEVLRRIYGRFVVEGGLKYPAFARTQNINRDIQSVPKDWHIYSGTDCGTGGEKGHPAAISFVAVDPKFRRARIFKGWRGDGEETTHSDILSKHRELRQGLHLTANYYDHHAKDFFIIASRAGETFIPAEKSHEIGEQVINVLFKNGALVIDDIPELHPLITELTTLKKTTQKAHAKDDFIDSMRYALTKIPFDWAAIAGAPLPGAETAKPEISYEEKHRRGMSSQELEEQMDAFALENEIDAWNDLMEI